MNPTSFHAELQNILMMFQMILLVGIYTGLPISIAIAWWYDSNSKRRAQ